MNQHYLGAIVAHQLAAFFADGVGHDNDGFVAANSANQCKSDALVTACGLYDDGVRQDAPLLLGGKNHLIGGTGFDGTADIQAFKFDKNLSHVRFNHTLQTDHRGVSHGIQNVVIYHNNSCSKVRRHVALPDSLPYFLRFCYQIHLL